MIHNHKGDDFINTTEDKQVFTFDPESIHFHGYDFGGKISIFFQKDEKVVFKVAGRNSWCSMGETKYYPPKFMIGTLENNIFTKCYEINYTRKYAKQAKEKAVELAEKICP